MPLQTYDNLKEGDQQSRSPRNLLFWLLIGCGVMAFLLFLTVYAFSQQHITVRDQSGNVLVSGYETVDAVSVAVAPQSVTIQSGQAQQFVATVTNALNTSVTWSASAGAIDPNGNFSLVDTVDTSVGVTATSIADPTKSASATVIVKAPVPAVAVAISPFSTTLVVGATQQFTATVTNATDTAVTWTVTGGGTVSGAGLFTAAAAGSAQVTATSNQDPTKAASASITINALPPPPPSASFDGPAELPRVYLKTALANTPTPGAQTQVAAGANLQTAINAANCGDTLLLAAGATFSGTFTLPAKACDDLHWIIIRTSAPDASLPPEGTRMLPCYAGVVSLPGRPSFSCSSTQVVTAQIMGGIAGPISLAAGANHYRLLGLEITRTAGSGSNYGLIRPIGQADHIIVDRVWLHGTAQDETVVGWMLNGFSYAALIDSYATDFHCTSVSGSCTDSKVLAGGTSSTADGSYKVTGNFLEAAGENILFGGGAATFAPADIEIRRNHFFKPLTWLQGQPGFVGGPTGNPFVVKNLLELKNAQRVLVEGNIFEYSWGGFSQAGWSILLTPKNQAAPGGGNLCPTCLVQDVTIRYNTLSHSGSGISIADVPSDNGGMAAAGQRYSIHDITMDDISASKYKGNGNLFQIYSAWSANSLNGLWINHVTGFPDPLTLITSLGNFVTDPPMTNFQFTNSIIGSAKYPVWSTGGGTGNCAYYDIPLTSLNACFPGGYKFTNNAFIAVNQSSYPPTKWPAGNLFPASVTAVGFVNFNNGNGGDYTLLPSSPYINAGTDGKNLGADTTAIKAATAGAY